MKPCILFLVIVIMVSSCKKGTTPNPAVSPTLPSIKTLGVTSVTRSSATATAKVLSDGHSSITAAGVCVAIFSNPNLTNSTIILRPTVTDSFAISLSGLSPNTTYYITSFITNGVGTAYGNEVVFKTNPITSPVVTTNPTVPVSTLFTTSPGGSVGDDGGSPLLAKGICWSSLHDPTITDAKSNEGTALGAFASPMNNLLANTTYYIKTYAINAIGTSYGQMLTVVLDRDGNVYNSVKIGDQVWAVENLKVTKLNNGTAIPYVPGNADWVGPNSLNPMYSWYNGDIGTKIPYGALYNWYSVNTGLLAPPSWHVPTHNDFSKLIHFLDPAAIDTPILLFGTDPFTEIRSYVAANKLEETGLDHWSTTNPSITNETGFTAVAGGWRHEFGGACEYMGVSGGLWTTTNVKHNGQLAHNSLRLLFVRGGLIYWPDGATNGYHVRILKD